VALVNGNPLLLEDLYIIYKGVGLQLGCVSAVRGLELLNSKLREDCCKWLRFMGKGIKRKRSGGGLGKLTFFDSCLVV